jgi:hypothetical protein
MENTKVLPYSRFQSIFALLYTLQNLVHSQVMMTYRSFVSSEFQISILIEFPNEKPINKIIAAKRDDLVLSLDILNENKCKNFASLKFNGAGSLVKVSALSQVYEACKIKYRLNDYPVYSTIWLNPYFPNGGAVPPFFSKLSA